MLVKNLVAALRASYFSFILCHLDFSFMFKLFSCNKYKFRQKVLLGWRGGGIRTLAFKQLIINHLCSSFVFLGTSLGTFLALKLIQVCTSSFQQ